MPATEWLDQAPTGSSGLDEVLSGGRPRERIDLIQGQPGVGKTTLAQALEQQNTLFEPWEVELQETTRRLLDHVDRAHAERMVIDSLSELRRSGPDEDTIRELDLSLSELEVGDPLVAFSGVLTGVPHYLGQPSALSQRE
jgi:circadian clock protein KaiC